MAQRIFIKVVGLSDEERHALNTVFRLSEQCRTRYQLWTPHAPEGPRVALLDGHSWEARVEAESPLHRDLKLLWIGAHAPAGVWRSLPRPIVWPDVIESLDALFSPDAVLDLDPGGAAEPAMSPRRALIVSADRSERLYLRARLALARMTSADDAENADQALQLARGKQYDLALVDSGLRDMDAWELLRRLRGGNHPVHHLAMTKVERSLAEIVRAKVRGAMLLEHPPHPGRLDAWLSRVELGAAG